MPDELRARALAALCETDPGEKARMAGALQAAATGLAVAQAAPLATRPVPGRPDRPRLVHPARVPRRSPNRPEGLAALLHAIAHIEFNAINLALDAAWRFDGMPTPYYTDWIRVAAEEAYHFTLVRELLVTLGHDYGDFDAHDGLWAMCEKTAQDLTARMALVPRTLEARGLDATPQIQDKLRRVPGPAAHRAVEILDIILRDEIGHVAVGNHWYGWLCRQQGLDPLAHYDGLAERYRAPRLHPPFNLPARVRAGFSEAELSRLGTAPASDTLAAAPPEAPLP